jgi:hypothetical protein
MLVTRKSAALTTSIYSVAVVVPPVAFHLAGWWGLVALERGLGRGGLMDRITHSFLKAR